MRPPCAFRCLPAQTSWTHAQLEGEAHIVLPSLEDEEATDNAQVRVTSKRSHLWATATLGAMEQLALGDAQLAGAS